MGLHLAHMIEGQVSSAFDPVHKALYNERLASNGEARRKGATVQIASQGTEWDASGLQERPYHSA